MARPTTTSSSDLALVTLPGFNLPSKLCSSGGEQLSRSDIPILPSPTFPSLANMPQAPCSPPPKPQNVLTNSFYELNNRSGPLTLSTPAFCPVPKHENKDIPYASVFPHNPNIDFSYSRVELDPYALPFAPVQAQVTFPHKDTYPLLRPTPPPLVFSLSSCRPHIAHEPQTDRFSTTTMSPVGPHLYSPHFPLGHVLNHDFVRKYAPGAQIGVGAFGFVITGRDRVLGHEVAIKFMERSKVPRWGWSNDPELGRVPTEAALLKLLDHPGIIKFLDFFQDQIYFYLVQELHGSPWSSKHCSTGSLLPRDLSTSGTFDEMPPFAFAGEPGSVTLSRPPMLMLDVAPNSCNSLYDNFNISSPSHSLSVSSSTSSSPPCSPVSPMTPPPEARPNMSRRQSHDLFECIEEHQRLSESQARYIFAQVVDVVDYLDSIGVTHRDIKDENVLIDRSFRVKLIDFGAASCVDPRLPGPRPWYRHFRGTVAYAPAEIIREVQCHQAEPADVWALGVLLSYLITGRSPFPTAADAAQGKIRLHNCRIRAETLLVNQKNTISAACWDVLTRCLDPDPSTRASIAEVKAHPWLGTVDNV